jgi:exopolysaccharide production protein ExoQ
VALSLAAAAVLPAYALMPDDRLLRGIFLHKNVLGQVLTFAAILLLLAWQFRFLPRTVTILGLGLVLVAAGLAGSSTACLLIAAVAVLQLLLHLATLGRIRAAAFLLLAAAAGSFLVMAALLLLEPLLGLIGRDLTFTGRTDLWAYVVRMVELRPLLGYGYGAFFELPSITSYVLDTLHWAAPNAHNGYLEIALGLGLPGLALALLFLLGGLGMALRTPAAAGRAGSDRLPAAFAFLYLAAFLLRNAAESDLLAPSQLSWVLAVLAVILASRRSSTSAGHHRQSGMNAASRLFTSFR